MQSIYVEIASLEDSELVNTIKDINNNKSGKYQITVGIYLVSTDEFLNKVALQLQDIDEVLWYIKHDPITINTLGITKGRKSALGMKWLIGYARKRGEKTMVDRLAGEIIAASKNEGAAIKKKEDTHKMAEANKAFSHFRF